jgi:malate synthase
VPRGTIKATVLIETILAAFEMEEILYELREHSAGLNAGRWDYIFSVIKKFHDRDDFVLPDRAQVTMTVPFMRAYTELLVRSCHTRGAHAIGGMAAFIPSRRDPEVNKIALARVTEDKQRESTDGFDGTWVAHPDLVPTASSSTPRSARKRAAEAAEVMTPRSPRRPATPGGDHRGWVHERLRGIRYIPPGFRASAPAIDNLMEDAATAEISIRSLGAPWRVAGRIEQTIAEVAAGLPIQSMPRRDSSSSTSRLRTTSPSSSRCPRTTGCLRAPSV